jgi:hypothetical protein
VTLSKLFDECLIEASKLASPDTYMSEVRERALEEFLRRVSLERGKTSSKPSEWKQETPIMQADAILGSVAGWISNLEDGTSAPMRVAQTLKARMFDLHTLCHGWLKETW